MQNSNNSAIKGGLDYAIKELGALIDSASHDTDIWDTFAFRLHELCPGTKMIFQAVDLKTSAPLPLVALGWQEETLNAYDNYFVRINPWKQAWCDAPTGRAIWVDDYLPHSQLKETEFYYDLLRREGEADSATAVTFEAGPERLGLLAIHFDHARLSQMQPIHDLLGVLGPKLSRSLQLSRLMATAKPKRPGGDLLDHLADAAFIVDERCRVVAANSAAETKASTNDVMRIDATGTLRLIGSHRENTALAQRVREVCINRAPVKDLMYGGESGDYLTFLPFSPRIPPLAQRGLNSLFSPHMFALLVSRCSAQGDQAADVLRSRFLLTKAEIRLALALEGGGSLVEIAERLGISYETARGYLKAIFNKTDTNRQRDLLALIVRLTEP